MDKENVKALFKLNLLTMNPRLTEQIREKMEKKDIPKDEIYRRLLLQGYGLSTVWMTLIYIGLILFTDFSKAPAVFDQYVMFFILLGVTQSFGLFYNILYDSRDLKHLLPLPLRSEEIYTAKLASIFIGTLQFLFPLMIFFIKFTIDHGANLFLGIVVGIYALFAMAMFFTLVTLLIMEGLTAAGVLRKTNTGLVGILSIAVSVGAIIFFLYMQTKITTGPDLTTDYGLLSGFLMKHPAWSFLIGLAVLLAGGAVILALGRGYVDHFLSIGEETKKTRAAKDATGSSLRSLLHYHFNLINDQVIVTQSLFSPILMILLPIITGVGSALSGDLKLSEAGEFAAPILPALAFFIGIYITITPGSLFKILFSAENEGFDYLKTLPLDFVKYGRFKVFFGALIYTLIFAVLYIIAGFVFSIPPLPVISAIIITGATLYAFGYRPVRWDFRNIVTGWSKISEVLERSGKWKQLLIYVLFLTLIVFILISAVFAYKNGVMPAGALRWAGLVFLLIDLFGLLYHETQWKNEGGM